MDTPALVLSGHVNALGVIRGLGEHRVPIVLFRHDAHDMAQASRYVRRSIVTTHPMADGLAFVEEIIRRARRLRGALVVPTSDDALGAVSRYKGELADHFVVACPDWETASACLDKALTYRLAADHRLPAPATVTPATLEEAIEGSRTLGFPLLVKPTQSHLYQRAFKRKLVRVADREELERRFSEAAAAGLAVVLQEFIPGRDDDVVNYNAYCWGGEVLVEFTARQLRKAPPTFGSPRVVVSEWVPEAISPGREVMAALSYCGFANIEMKRDARDGRFKLIEVNARHNMSSLLAVRCGVNFPLIEYRHRIQGVEPRPQRQREGLYWFNGLQDAAYSLRGFRHEGLRFADYVRPYLRPHCDAILDRHDPGPFGARLTDLGDRAWQSAKELARGVVLGRTGIRGLH